MAIAENENSLGYLYYPISDPKIKVYVPAKESCNTTIGFRIQLTPDVDGLGENPVVFEITLKSLTVSFDRLVTALTCPGFPLNALREDVAWSVLRAAVGSGSTDVCSVDKNPFEGSDGYTWAVAPNQTTLTYVAKKGDKEAFRIIFPVDNDGKSEPTVWVKNVPDNVATVAQEIVSKNTYPSYVLRVAVGDTDLGEYGQSARIKAISEYAMSAPAIATYAGTCAITTGICEAFKGPAGWAKAIAYDLPGCVVAAVFSGMTFSMEATASKEAYAKSIGVGVLIGMGSEALQYKLATRGLGTRWLGIDKGTTIMHIRWIANEGADAPKKVGDILDLLKKSPSGLAGVDYKKVPVGTVLGITADDLKNLEKNSRG